MNAGLKMMGIAVLAGAAAACGQAPAAEQPPAEAVPTAATNAPEAAPAAPPASAQAAVAAPRPNNDYDWYTRLDDSERTRSMVLAYEVPDTDDQPLGLSCEEGGERIFASLQSSTVGVRSITLASTNGSRDYRVKTAHAEEEVMPGEYLTIEIPGDDATLAAFRQSGWMTLTYAGHTTNMAAHPDSGARQRIVQFMDFCNG